MQYPYINITVCREWQGLNLSSHSTVCHVRPCVHSMQVVPNALKTSRASSTSGRSQSTSSKEGKIAGKKRKLTTLEEIRLVSQLYVYLGEQSELTHLSC